MKQRLFLFLFLPFLACADLGPEEGEARLIPGVSVDGVRFGVSWEEVVQLLGEGYRIGSTDGAVHSGYILGYRTGEHSGLSIYFPEWSEFGGAWGPVIRIGIDESYTGKSREGVGIGSTREEMRAAFGDPESFSDHDGSPYTDNYSMNGRKIVLEYSLGKVRSINMY